MSPLLPILKAFARQRTFYKTLIIAYLLVALTVVSQHALAQSGPPQEWFKKYGESESEIISCWVETADGYLIGGSSRSGVGTDKTSPNKGESDYWVIKLDKSGNKVWDQAYGGSSNDILKAIVKTSDNNFLLAGSSASSVGSDKTTPNKGNSDFWIVKISSNGSKLWDKTYGGANRDELVTAISTQGGGFLLAGNSNSPANDDKTQDARPHSAPYSPGYDYWIIKINDSGEKVFDKTFGGSGFNQNGEEVLKGEDVLTSLVETSEGGFLLGGHSDSEAGFEKSVNNTCYYCQGDYAYGRPFDYWIIKLNADGIKLWDKVYGGSGDEYLWKIAKGPEGQYLLMGASGSAPAGQPEDGFYMPYIWAVVIDEAGTISITQEEQLSSNEDDNWFTHLSASADASGYYLLSQENKHLEIVVEKYDWSGNFLWTKSIASRTTDESTGEYDDNSGFIELNATGELFIGASGYDTSTDYWIYKFRSEAPPISRFFYKGVDLNSKDASSIKVGEVYYQGDKLCPDFSCAGKPFANQTIPLEPAPDADKAKMLRSSVASSKTIPAVFTFNNIAAGTYEVYLYVWEDNYPTVFSIDIQSQRVLNNYNSGAKGSWAKLGPFKTSVTDGAIHVVASGGDANVSGIEIWRTEEGLLERAIDFNGSASITNIEGEVFEADKNVPDFTFTGRTFENQSIALTPATDDNTAKMIRSSIYSTCRTPSTLSIGTQTSGAYNVYLYLWEDNYSDHFTLDIDDQITYQGSTGNKGQWQLLGPFKVISGDNRILIKASGGDANLSGVKLYKLNNSDAAILRTTTEVASIESEITSFNAYPIPLEKTLTVAFPEVYTGKANISILDRTGQTYIQQEKHYNGEKEASLDLPIMKPGVYFLKVQYGAKSEIKKLIKE